MNSSGSVGSCGSGMLTGNRPTTATSNILNRALEVMNTTIKDTSFKDTSLKDAREPDKCLDDAGDTEDESEKEQTPSVNSSSHSDDDNNAVPTDPTSRLGNITAQLSFRKIAKKRRKAGGRISFHHTKSSKEYLRKAQEAYQRLINSEQKQQIEPEIKSDREDHVDPKTSSHTSVKTKDSEEVDYGYGDTTDTQTTKDAVDYGYGDSADSQPKQPIDYGYGDPADDPPQPPSRRGGRPRRRNSVTKFSVDSANVVAAQAAAQRILKLKPSLTALSRSDSTTPTRSRLQQHQDQPQPQPQRSNTSQNRDFPTRRTGRMAAMQSPLQRQDQPQETYVDLKDGMTDTRVVDRLKPPQRSRSSRYARGVPVDGGSIVNQSLRLRGQEESKELRHDNRSGSRQTLSSPANPHFELTSDYFSSDPKPNNLSWRNASRPDGATFRFSTPARTLSGLSFDNSHDNSYSMVDDDDDDADSLASDMESLCSIRDSSYRMDAHHGSHSLKNMDIPPVAPRSCPASPLIIALPPPDRRTRFSGSRSNSGESFSNLRRSNSDDSGFRKPLVVSWSNSSNKEGSLSHFSVDKSRTAPRRRQSGNNDFPILPYLRRAVPTNGSGSTSCMPAPVRRTPSFKGSQQRQD